MVLKTKFETTHLDPSNTVFELGMIFVYVNFLIFSHCSPFRTFPDLSLCCPTLFLLPPWIGLTVLPLG